jgi:hypothetical protein
MEPHREEQQKAPPPRAAPRLKRFRIVKVEERIAPSGTLRTYTCHCNTWFCHFTQHKVCG